MPRLFCAGFSATVQQVSGLFLTLLIGTSSCGSLEESSKGPTTQRLRSSTSGISQEGSNGCSGNAPASPTNTCTEGCSASEAIIFLSAQPTSDGAFGGRTGADQRCLVTRTTQYPTLSCNRVKALISVSLTDQLKDLPSLCKGAISATTRILRPTRIQVSPSWSGLLSNTLELPIVDTNGSPTSVWTGSETDGSLAQFNCNQFTLSAGSTSSYGLARDNQGSPTQTGFLSAGSAITCNNSAFLYCLCF